jgi:DNA-binding CsgD family transcriptional regulator
VSLAARHLVGREEELEAIVGLLSAPDDLPGVAVLSGEAGIGKTALWLAGIEAASARGYRVLSSRPSDAETKFSFGGLTDLLDNTAAEVLAELPPLQRRALEAALLLGESEIQADDRAVAAAFLGALRLLAGDRTLCLAVDDVQWLDAASLAALRHVLARLDGEPVAALLAVRGDVPAWIRRAVLEERLRTVEVGGLSVGATHELLRARLDARFQRPTLIRLWETSRGNPFFALELASALQRRGGTLAPSEELPIPSDLAELLQARIDDLGPAALEVARAVAALADATVALVEAVVGASFDSGLAEALEARILELDGRRLRFTHPLLSSAVAARQTPARRRSLHARMAEVVPSAEERARHLAVATNEPDHRVAAALEEAALAAQARGAPAAAAELAEQALRLTPRSEVTDARRRLLLAADRYFIAGDTVRATALLGRARAEATPGVERAAVLVELGDVMWDSEPQEAEALYLQALAEAEGDDALEARIHRTLAEVMGLCARLERGGAHATLAVEAALRTDDVALKCCAFAVRAELRFKAGSGIARAEMEEALALERALPAWPLVSGPTEYFCHHLVWSAELERARELLLELVDARRTQHDAGSEAWALWNLALLEWRAGNWDVADRYATESLDLSTQLGASPIDEFPTATIAAHKGRVVDARALAQPSIARGEAGPVETEQAGNDWVLGFLALSLGEPAAALEQLRRSYERRNRFTHEPGQRLELGDLLEALIAVGELDEADEVLATWQERADALDRAWALAILARGRGLLLAARGDLEGAFGCFERALAEHARSTDPFHHARTLLALGRTQRRARRRAAARSTLAEALTAFERLGAPLWAEQARSELARIGGRAPSGGELTEAERRIAALVAEGGTNREVAAALFLTVHSVETALTRIYRKLDVRSRAELAHLLAAKS